MQRVHNVEVQWFTATAGLFGPVQHRDVANSCGKRLHKILHRERAIQSYLQQADPLAASIQVIDRLVRRFRAGTHHHDHAFRIGCSGVFEEAITSSDHLRELVHSFLRQFRTGVVKRIDRFANLEKDIRILRRSPQHGMLR